MKPVPNIVLSGLLLALCCLCAWQWNREASLRSLVATQQGELIALHQTHIDLEAQVKAADAEVLRITASLAELRSNSVSKEAHDETVQAVATLRETVTKQNAAITQQNELIVKQNGTIQAANDSLKKATATRDQLATRLNEVTALYNKLAKVQ